MERAWKKIPRDRHILRFFGVLNVIEALEGAQVVVKCNSFTPRQNCVIQAFFSPFFLKKKENTSRATVYLWYFPYSALLPTSFNIRVLTQKQTDRQTSKYVSGKAG